VNDLSPLAKLELGKTGGVFRFQNPIWRLDFPMKKQGFRFPPKIF
jgi:hypothetical protein